jgi:hypothetical protein
MNTQVSRSIDEINQEIQELNAEILEMEYDLENGLYDGPPERAELTEGVASLNRLRRALLEEKERLKNGNASSE